MTTTAIAAKPLGHSSAGDASWNTGPRFRSSPNACATALWESCSYLTAIRSTALRLALGISQRLVRINPHGQIHYGDFVIPAGVPFGMSSCLQHRDARIFPRPNEFRPERWLAQSGTGPRKQPLARYSVPFGRGPRMCLGMNLALAEIHIVLANVFRRFQMELSETRADAVDMAADFFIPIPQKGTRGVRVLVA